MPLIQNRPGLSRKARELAGELAEEIGHPTPVRDAVDQPLIVEDHDSRAGDFAVTVRWEKWADIALRERGGMILDAYERARGKQEMSKITRALGLTASEADRLGITFPAPRRVPSAKRAAKGKR